MYGADAECTLKGGASGTKEQGENFMFEFLFLSCLKIILFHQDLETLAPAVVKETLTGGGRKPAAPHQDLLAAYTCALVP